MKRHSCKQLAAAYVKLRARYAAEPLVRALARELVRQRLAHEVDRLVAEIGRELWRQRHVLLAEVVSARPLSHTQQRRLMTLLTGASGSPTVHVSYAVDSSLIGGVRVRTPEAVLEATVRGQLAALTAL